MAIANEMHRIDASPIRQCACQSASAGQVLKESNDARCCNGRDYKEVQYLQRVLPYRRHHFRIGAAQVKKMPRLSPWHQDLPDCSGKRP